VNNTIDLKGLKSETSRVYLRTFKKVTKCNEKLQKITMSGDDNIQEYNDVKLELEQLQNYFSSVSILETKLKEIRTISDKNFDEIVSMAQQLNISDKPPPSQIRGEKKPKGLPSPPRKPYYPYLSHDNIIIRVGREATDNDQLSCNPEYRHPDEWWLHVSGYAGSHVVIRSKSDDLPEKFHETLKDAAILAAVNSKASQIGKVSVTYTRCRNVSKPVGAKPGLVYLKDNVSTITMNVKSESTRLERLLKTKGVNEDSLLL
jgi:predicted ribosome quality control (RQC) complex YloA/Tae2 family protein